MTPASRLTSRRILTFAVAAPFVLVALACEGTDCATAPQIPLRIEVVDGTDGSPRAAGALGIVFVGDSVVDSLRASTQAAGERYLLWTRGRPGDYGVRVEHAGYEDWVADEVYVGSSGSGCAVTGTRLRAALVRLESR